MESKDVLLARIREGKEMNFKERLYLTIVLALPSILAQISNVMMSYIDAGMVGRLGATQAASIGLVSTCTWLFGGFCMATSSGFSVQVAQLIGANRMDDARDLIRKAFVSVLIFSCTLCVIGLSIANYLPAWLGGGEELRSDATKYFLIYAAFLPMLQLWWTASAMLQASGNTRTPSMLNAFSCLLDVGFNYLFIYVLHMGVAGAALGTGVAITVTAMQMMWLLCVRSKELSIVGHKGHWRPDGQTLRTAWKISGPMYLQNIVMRGAYVACTLIVAPLGTIAIAANSFAVTAESFCYMAGYGIEDSATALVGQSMGAKRKSLASSFAYICCGAAAVIMTLLAVLMYIFAPQMMAVLTPDREVIALGASCLRIEAFAETLYAISIVAYGACVGAGDTLVPSAINLGSMWVVRIGLALLLIPHFGLKGYWIAMMVELNVRGLVFLGRLISGRWQRKAVV